MFWSGVPLGGHLTSFCYAPPDTGEPDLQLVALERLLSIEGALEIQMNFTFLRGPCRSRAPPLQIAEQIKKTFPQKGAA